MNKTIINLVLAVVLITASLPLVAQSEPPEGVAVTVPGLLVEANKAYLAKDYLAFRKAMEGLHRLRPYNGQYMYQLVVAHALLDEKDQAYGLMLRMQQQGLSYDFSKTDSTDNIKDTEVFEYVNDLMVMAGEPVGETEPEFVLPASVLMPETIAWDESRQKFLIGTVTEGSILAVDGDGQVTELLRANKENGLGAVLDVLVDQARNRLWVSSAALPAFSGFSPADKGRSALFEFDLESLELIRRYPVPDDARPHILGSMVLSPNGDIFIVDRALPLIYKKPADEQVLKAVLASREMVSMRGIAMQPDGALMYVGDREMGILIIDVKGGRVGKLKVPDTLNLGGIDGLYLWNNHLVVIQDGINPQRVMRLELDSTGTQVTMVRPLAVAQPDFDSPSYGTVRGEDLYFFANRQATDSEGRTNAVTVLQTPINSSKDLVVPDMREYLDQRAKRLENKYNDPEEDQPETP